MHLNTPSTSYIHGYIYGSELMDPKKTDLPILYDQFCGPLFGTLILIHSQNGIFSDAISKTWQSLWRETPIVVLW